MYDAIVSTPVGFVGIQCVKTKLLAIRFLDKPIRFSHVQPPEKVREIAKRIEAFFAQAQCLTDLPHRLQGTLFQKKVWRSMCNIPLGETRTYGELAKALGGTSARAIGSACRANPLPLVIPCHRVVGTNGLGGFCGEDNKVSIKNWLLAHERHSC